MVSLLTLFSQMSDVEAGGATVFPDFGAAIWPKKVKSLHVCSLFSSPFTVLLSTVWHPASI